ncbi:MAG: transglutaminase domain-containing protein [Eubacterium sp.]|nr:transglutaminase domain-containing protein [Eubacterium sp.]
MNSKGTKIWQYLLDGALLLALALPLSELLYLIPGLMLQRVFFLCYFAAFFLTALLLEAFGRSGLTLRLLPAFPVAIGLISRDLPLFLNCLFALLLFAVLHLLLSLSFRKWILLPILAVLLILWIPKEDMPGYVAGSLILLFFGLLSEFIGNEKKSWLLLLGLTASLAFLLPSSEDPIRWEGLRRMISRAGEMMSTAWNNISYFFEGFAEKENTAYMGYSETGGLAGSITGEDREALQLITGRKTTVYLSGATYALMTPDGFPERLGSDKPVNSWLAMYLSALSETHTSRDEVSCFSRSERADISYTYIRTSDLLIPSTTFRITNSLKYGLTDTENKGFTYDLNYLELDKASPYFRRFVEKAALMKGTADYSEASETAWRLYNFRLSEYLTESEYYAALEQSRKDASDPRYLDISMATEDILRLSEEITAGCGTELEKALKIEAFLRQYTYDTSTDLRGRENYIQSFLFDEQRGYCMHYASAMVLLLRLSGIPARYVQGFLCDPDETGSVSASSAHAWVEGYLTGYGWLRFEPTAVMPGSEDNGWGLMVADKSKEEELPLPEESEVIQPPSLPDPVINRREEKDGKTLKGIILTIALYVGAIVGSVLLLILIFLFLRRLHYHRLSPKDKLLTDMKSLREKLEKLYPAEESFFDYLPHITDESSRGKLEELFRDYYRVRFRGDPVTPELNLRAHKSGDLLVSCRKM